MLVFAISSKHLVFRIVPHCFRMNNVIYCLTQRNLSLKCRWVRTESTSFISGVVVCCRCHLQCMHVVLRRRWVGSGLDHMVLIFYVLKIFFSELRLQPAGGSYWKIKQPERNLNNCELSKINQSIVFKCMYWVFSI